MPPFKQLPAKPCEHCGALMTRKLYGDRWEDAPVFQKRRFCSLECSAMARRMATVKQDSLLWRQRKLRMASCQECGTKERLQLHHMDENRENEAPENLKTLCASCHAKWHWAHGKQPMPKKALACSVCGAGGKLRRGMCQAHYRRVKTHGDPLAHVPVLHRRTGLDSTA